MVLYKLGIDYFIFVNSGGGGLIIIEVLEVKIGYNLNVISFGIVFMILDDMGYVLGVGVDNI